MLHSHSLCWLYAAAALSLAPLCAQAADAKPRVIDGYRELRAVNEDPNVLRPMPTATWPRPSYPVAARKNREECALVLRVFYGVDGRAVRVDPVAVVGSRALAKHAMDFVRANWAVTPVASAETRKPLRVFFETPLSFTLDEGYGSLARRLREAGSAGGSPKQAILRLARAEAGRK